MIIMNKYVSPFIPLLVVGFLTGCGGGGGGGDTPSQSPVTTTPSASYNVSGIDDPIVGAMVSAPECATYSDNGGGKYTLKECISKPSMITLLGGFIDSDGDGLQESSEISQSAPLMLKTSQASLVNNFVVSPLTTLATKEDNLSKLANALGISKDAIFGKDNTDLMRTINTLLIASRDAGISKYDEFVADLKDRILDSSSTGISAVTDARDYMSNHVADYKSRFGIAFGGFVDDSNGTIGSGVTDPLAVLAEKTSVTTGKILLAGFVYDYVIKDANVTIYKDGVEVASTSSDSNGRYSVEITQDLLNSDAVFKLVAELGSIKLLSYVTTQELKAGEFGRKISSGSVPDLVISNVTTAKAVLVTKFDENVTTDSALMTAVKEKVETFYSNELLETAAAIKDVVDNNKTIDQNDTIQFAQSIVDINQTSNTVVVTIPASIDANTTAVTEDPTLNVQLASTTVESQDNIKNYFDGHTLYNVDYYSSSSYGIVYGELSFNGSNGHWREYYYDEYNTQSWIKNDKSEDFTISYSSDGTIAYTISDNYQPEKHTLVSKETIPTAYGNLEIMVTKDVITAEPTAAFYDNIPNSDTVANLSFTSLSDANKTLEVHYADGGTNTIVLYDDGTYNYGYNGSSVYKYRVLSRDSKTYIVMDDGETQDGGGNIIYLDFVNKKGYVEDYHDIGFTEYSFLYNSVAVDILKNIDIWDLAYKIDQAHQNSAGYSATNTWYMVTERTIYEYFKSLRSE